MFKSRFLLFVFVLAGLPALAWGASISRFVVTGDSRGGDNGINSAILSELVPAIVAEQADLVVFSGDLTNNGTLSQLEYWVQTFMAPLAASGIPVYPCRGNHDGVIEAWNTVFSAILPGNGPSGQEYLTYSVAYDNALFILFDGLTINQAFVDEQLEGKTQPHVFFCNHYPAFAVQHADGLSAFPEARDAFWDSIGNAHGRTYFTGHDHFYDHTRILDSRGHPIEQYIVGTAGAPLYDWGGTYPDPRVQPVAHFKSYGYLVVDIDGTEVQLTYKERVAPNVYEATDDVFTYGTPFPTENLPAAHHAGLIAAVFLVLIMFALLVYGVRRRLDY